MHMYTVNAIERLPDNHVQTIKGDKKRGSADNEFSNVSFINQHYWNCHRLQIDINITSW